MYYLLFCQGIVLLPLLVQIVTFRLQFKVTIVKVASLRGKLFEPAYPQRSLFTDGRNLVRCNAAEKKMLKCLYKSHLPIQFNVQMLYRKFLRFNLVYLNSSEMVQSNQYLSSWRNEAVEKYWCSNMILLYLKVELSKPIIIVQLLKRTWQNWRQISKKSLTKHYTKRNISGT